MWITNYIAKERSSNPVTGEITGGSSVKADVFASGEYNNMRMAVPYGVIYNPPVGATGVVLPTERGNMLIGVCPDDDIDLDPGEVMLYSSGGASIVLKNNGKVLINGKEV
ncbi:MAG: hypothetical protein ACI4RL_02160 [Ruminococcus sp.]